MLGLELNSSAVCLRAENKAIVELEALNKKLRIVSAVSRGQTLWVWPRETSAEVGGTNTTTQRYAKHDEGYHYKDFYEEYSGYNPRSRASRCEIIHIAVVAAGYKTSRAVVTLVKTLQAQSVYVMIGRNTIF